jgi:hypothetical protein
MENSAQSSHSATQFPWYDSPWLTSFVRARAHIARHYPAKLAEFDATLAILRTPTDFSIKHIPQLFASSVHEELRQMVATLALEEFERHELLDFGRLVIHDKPLLSLLQQQLTPKVSDWVGEEVEPSYNFLSLYNNLGICEPHMDAPLAKWTVDFCISQSAPWPIHFSQVLPWPENWQPTSADWVEEILRDPANHFSTYELQEGAALVFAGSSQWHYRQRIARSKRHNFCNLAFFHFIPKGQRALINPANWAGLFGVAELQELVIKLP